MFERLVVAMAESVVDTQAGDDGPAGWIGEGHVVGRPHRSGGVARTFGPAGARRWACLLVSLLAVAAVWFMADVVKLPQADSATLPTRVVSYTVRPGDTLWAYASSVTPEGGDIAQTVNELMSLNELDSAVLVPGQRIIVPAD